MTATASAHKHPNYIGIFFGLLALTIAEVGVAYVSMGHGLKLVALLALAVIKVLLVALFYMHLKFDKRLLSLIALAPFVLLSLVGLLLYTGIILLQ